MDTQGGNVMS